MGTKPRLAALLAVLVAACAVAGPARQEFPTIQVSDLSGQTVPLKDVLGTVTVLNFWATWCGPCRLEMPFLEKLYNELGGRGLVVLAVNVDLPASPDDLGVGQQLELLKPRIQAFLKASGISLPVYMVNGPTQIMLGLDRIPYSIVLDRKGGVVRVYPGYSAESSKDLRQQVLEVLAERSEKGGK